MTAHEQRILTEALKSDADMRRDAMRQQERAFGAGFRSVRNMIEARQTLEVRK